jgi:hypothetical protein
MRLRSTTITGLAALGVAAGCASIIGIPERTAEWCLQPPQNGHAFCDDFDHADAESQWSVGTGPGPGVRRTYVPTGETAPNALDLQVDPLDAGDFNVTAIEKDFPSQTFGHVHVEADVKFVHDGMATVNNVSTGLGFLLLELKPSVCIGVGLSPPGIALVVVTNSLDCTTAGNSTPDSGFTAGSPITLPDGGTGYNTATIVSGTPEFNAWLHFVIDVRRGSDGSGAVNFEFTGPGSLPPPQIPAGALPETGVTALALAASVTGPSGLIDIQFDNVTVDIGN